RILHGKAKPGRLIAPLRVPPSSSRVRLDKIRQRDPKLDLLVPERLEGVLRPWQPEKVPVLRLHVGGTGGLDVLERLDVSLGYRGTGVRGAGRRPLKVGYPPPIAAEADVSFPGLGRVRQEIPHLRSPSSGVPHQRPRGLGPALLPPRQQAAE